MDFFIASFTVFERSAKIALALKMSRHNVFLIYCDEPNDQFFKSCFTECYKVENSLEIDNLIKKLNIKLIHIFSTFTDQLALYLVKNKKVKTIFDYKDIFEGLLNLPFEREHFYQQEFLIRNADYICHRDFQINDYEKFKGIKKLKKFYYPDLVWPNHPIIRNKDQIKLRLNSKIRLVLIGNFTIEKVEPQWAGLGYIAIILSLLSQGFEVHIYPTTPMAKNSEAFSDYFHLAAQYNSFIIHQAKPIQDLHFDLFNYDFGIIFLQYKYFDNLGSYMNECILRTAIPTRVMDYIGAGLPILYSDEIQQLNFINSKYKVGIKVDRDNFFRLQDLIKKYNYQELKRNNYFTAFYNLNSKRWINKLINFYYSIMHS